MYPYLSGIPLGRIISSSLEIAEERLDNFITRLVIRIFDRDNLGTNRIDTIGVVYSCNSIVKGIASSGNTIYSICKFEVIHHPCFIGRIVFHGYSNPQLSN